MCFINGHYELFVDALAQAELEYESIIFKQDFKTSAKETLQKFPPSKTQHSLQFFHRHKIIRGKTGFTDFLNFDTVVVGSEGNVVVLEALKGLFQYGYY